nr:MAG TPA: hypothetical protein [Caudoviricetes sp.]
MLSLLPLFLVFHSLKWITKFIGTPVLRSVSKIMYRCYMR